MNTVISWLETEWLSVLVPVGIFWVTLILTFLLRKLLYDYLKSLVPRDKWKANEKIINAIREPSALWCLFLSIYLSLHISGLPWDWKVNISRIMWTLLLVSLAIPLLRIVGSAILFYGQSARMDRRAILFIRSVLRVSILLIVVMVGLEIWGVSTNLFLLVLVVAILALVLAFKDGFPNFFAGIQMGASQQIKVGDYIKLGGGEEGYITKIGWNSTTLQTLEENRIIIPNNNLLQRTVVNCGQPLRKAIEPFRFNTRRIIKASTGLKAANLAELAEKVKIVPNEVIYCHTYRCLEEDPYLALESPNDFAAWAKNVLGDRVLSERLSNIHLLGFAELPDLRRSLINVFEEYLFSGYNPVTVPYGREFYFVKATCVISPTPYLAHDLREFVEVLRKVSLDSLYFHILGSRLRLENGMNDFSLWLENNLGEVELGREISLINPYTYTPESLRSELIKSIEKRIK